jgi:hypothetical protein
VTSGSSPRAAEAPLVASAIVPLVAAALGAMAGCRDAPAGAAAASASAAPLALAPPPPATGPAQAARAAAIEDELSTRPMDLLRFAFTSGVERREPKDELSSARPGQRVYAWLAIRNRTGRPRSIHLAWTVDGKERTKLDLEIAESWQFRTWGFNTVLPDDRGMVRLEVTDDAGNALVERELPIRP